MKFARTTLATLALAAARATADLCAWKNLLALGSPDTLPYEFNLVARSNNGTTYPVVQSTLPLPGGFFFPLSLGAANLSLSDPSVPIFQLQYGTLYAEGGLVTSTEGISLLLPLPVYVSSDNRQEDAGFEAVNATCGDKLEVTIRFAQLLPLALGSAAVNSSFAVGSTILSPLIDNTLSKYNLCRCCYFPLTEPNSSDLTH